MTFPRTRTGALALCTALVATPTLADVTTADVLANQQAYMGAMGITLVGALDGDVLRAPKLTGVLPMGVGGFEITGPDVTMISNGDGTVSITYPSPAKIAFSGYIQDVGEASATMTFTHDSYDITVSGNPGDVTYDTTVTNLGLGLDDWSATDVDSGAIDVTMDVNMTEWVSRTRIVEGNLIQVTSDSTIGTNTVDVSILMDGINSTTKQTTLPSVNQMELSLPTGGSNLMNLSQSLRDGLSVSLSNTADGNTSSTVTTMDGREVSSDESSTGAQSLSLSFDEAGLAMLAEAADFNMTMNDPMLFPGGISFGVAAMTADWLIPVNTKTEAQPFRAATSIEGLTVGDALWDMLDPAGELPRDPATIAFDLSGTGTLGMDLLDVMGLSMMAGPPPITVDQVTVDRLEVAAVGARATAEGAMTLNWADMMTWGGMPAPDGNVTVNVEGANALMDKLVAMGLLAPEDIMGAQMMMGMFAEPVGPDALRAEIEVTEGGSLFVNGQQLQ
ncbi:MAG: protein of unknown function DUF2125 [Rhodobacteraceae bacterium HLUCCA08]|nr:MAG: protein of unknown function DUF2125 [Rhodobacteraceae bacterium HLUCCA08]